MQQVGLNKEKEFALPVHWWEFYESLHQRSSNGFVKNIVPMEPLGEILLAPRPEEFCSGDPSLVQF